MLDILLTTRNIPLSPTSSLFQNYSLGSQVFETCYQIPAYVSSEPYLLKYDRPLISPDTSDQLIKLRNSHKIFCSAMTARPSLYPTGSKKSPSHFPPEAEMALELVGLSGMPVIGLGTLEYAKTIGWTSQDAILKPAPFHALAAMMAACGFSVTDATQAAVNLIQQGRMTFASELPIELKVYIFEDTTGGIRSMDQAANLLNRFGIRLSVQRFGISHQLEKIKSLEKIGAKVFPSTEAALKFAIKD
jgi:hypothetical protein